MIRFSKKLKKEIKAIADQNELLNRLIKYYTTGTCLEDCAKLFDCTVEYLIYILKEWEVYEHKKCSKCNELREFSEFYETTQNKCGLTSICRICQCEHDKKYFRNNREHKRKYDREYKRQPHILEKRLEYQKEYFKNPDKRKLRANRANNRYHNEIAFRLHTIMSVYINKFVKKGGVSINQILGYSMDALREHLESKFDDKMNWDNYGTYWHIDHIVGIANFNFTSYEDEAFKKCWSLENLQPLYGPDNLRKKKQFRKEWGNVELAAQLL